MKDHNCIRDFSSGVLYMRDGENPRQVTLRPVNRRPCLRRIYVSYTTEIPPRSQLDIPRKSVWPMLSSVAVDWLVERQQHLGGVLIARTLLSPHEQRCYVRILNCSPNTCTIPAGELLATAEAVESQNVSSSEQCTQITNDYADVQCLIDELPSCLTLGKRQDALAIIRQQTHVFSNSAIDLGRNGWRPHRIDTGDHPPTKQPMRRHPYALLSEIERNVQELLAIYYYY
jgi:hypothetical protein